MKFKVAQFTIQDFIENYDDVSEALNKSCTRNDNYFRIQGICQTDSAVLFMLEKDSIRREYIIAPFLGTSDEDVIADVYSRWQHNGSTRGMIKLEKLFLGVFEKPADFSL